MESDEIPRKYRPTTIYHYCSLASFISIIESKHIWLSDAYSVNDTYECRWISRHVREVIRGMKGKREIGVDSIFARLLGGLDEGFNIPYMASFSGKEDVLSQWRAYADDGRGVAIGFNPNAFELKFRAPNSGGELEWSRGIAKVVYGHDEQRVEVKEILERVVEYYKPSERIEFELYHEAYCDLAQLAPVYKNPAFIEEDEWRIIYIPEMMYGDPKARVTPQSSKMCSRSTGSNISFYFQLPFVTSGDIKPINEVIMGPKCEVSYEKMGMLLDYLGYGQVPLGRSKATYR